jgi:glycosyltransferase involved in cell wall biosynthesis
MATVPKVSVIVTTFNRRDFLLLTLQSILRQTLREIEVIVVDNFSDYDVRGVIDEFNDERLRLIRNRNYGVIAVNRNVGFRAAHGQYIALCDDDDLWHPEKLERQVDSMERTGSSLCFTALGYIDENNNPLPDRHYKLRPYYRSLTRNAMLLSIGFISNSSVMMSREAREQTGFLDEDPQLCAVEDFQYWSRILTKYSASFLPEPLTLYRIHSSNNQSSGAVAWLRKQLHLHRSIHRAEPIPVAIYALKFLKVGFRFLYLAIRNSIILKQC